MEQLKSNEWVNEGFAVKLTQGASKQGIIGHIKDGDKKVSEEAIAFATKLANQHSNSIEKKREID